MLHPRETVTAGSYSQVVKFKKQKGYSQDKEAKSPYCCMTDVFYILLYKFKNLGIELRLEYFIVWSSSLSDQIKMIWLKNTVVLLRDNLKTSATWYKVLERSRKYFLWLINIWISCSYLIWKIVPETKNKKGTFSFFISFSFEFLSYYFFLIANRFQEDDWNSR